MTERDDRTSDMTPELAERRLEERRPVEEAGGGVAEGFEQAEQELIDRATHAQDGGAGAFATDSREEIEDAGETHGEADGTPQHDR
jgi:hypothetical protein